MSELLNNQTLTNSSIANNTSPEYIANLLLGCHPDACDWDTGMARQQRLLMSVEALREFAIAKELDAQMMTEAVAPYYITIIPNAIDHSFARLELVAADPDTNLSAYADDKEANLFLWSCKEEDGSQVRFDDISIPYNLIGELGTGHKFEFDGDVCYGQTIDPMHAVNLYKNHRNEIVDLTVNYSLRDVSCFFKYFVECITQGLNNKAIADELEELVLASADDELENEVLPTLKPTP